MATPKKTYTVVGFSDVLDWRALNFVEPIPSNRICQACGLVTSVMAFLPCFHVFCKRCYEQCRSDDGLCCLFDGERVEEDDVNWNDFPVENLLKRKVKCWNEDRGCDVALPLSQLNEHFISHCDHHSTWCPKCSAVVLCSNVCAHIESDCRDHVVSVESSAPKIPTNQAKANLTAWNGKIDARTREIKEKLDEVAHENTSQSNSLNQISLCMDLVKETVLEMLSKSNTLEHVASSSEVMKGTLRGHGEKLDELAATISISNETLKQAFEGTRLFVEQVKENTSSTLKTHMRELFSGESTSLKESLRKELKDATRTICSSCTGSVAKVVEAKDWENQVGSIAINTERILALSTININRHEFVVHGLKAAKERASSEGYFSHQEKEMYISGYHLSPGVYLSKKDGNVLICPAMQLHGGTIDNVLEWPFKKDIRLTVKQFSGSKECDFVGVTSGKHQYYERPDEGGKKGVFYTDSTLIINDLERDGYVVDDKLRVIWELVSKNAV